jgi:hypothetical protein
MVLNSVQRRCIKWIASGIAWGAIVRPASKYVMEFSGPGRSKVCTVKDSDAKSLIEFGLITFNKTSGYRLTPAGEFMLDQARIMDQHLIDGEYAALRFVARACLKAGTTDLFLLVGQSEEFAFNLHHTDSQPTTLAEPPEIELPVSMVQRLLRKALIEHEYEGYYVLTDEGRQVVTTFMQVIEGEKRPPAP